MKPDKSSNSNTWKLLLRSASAFITKPPEASQSHTDRIRIRRCLARGNSIGLATPPRRSRMDSDSESEPDSPRVSCVGQIEIAGKGKKKKKKSKEKRGWMWEKKKKRKMKSTMEVEFEGVTENGAEASSEGIETTPYLGRMKRLASGRGSLSDFEWKLVGGEGEPSTSY